MISVLDIRSQDHGVAGRSNPNPLERKSKKLLGLEDVVLAVDWQFVEAPTVSDGSLPSRHGEVFHRDTVELEDARWIVVQLLTILDVGHPNLYFIQLVQNVSLSETQGCVSIQLTRELEQRYI